MADLYDLLQATRYELTVGRVKPKPKKPKPYPRPWIKAKGERIGRGAIKITDFEDWWKEGAHGRKK